MDIIGNYLETMFQSLPNTPNVQKAKEELYSMLEDKYQALILEGMSEEEALAKVIAECGSIEELASELGFEPEYFRMREQGVDRTKVSGEMTRDYLSDSRQNALYMGIAVGLFILSLAVVAELSIFDLKGVGVVCMFLMIALGVVIIIMSSAAMSKWSFLKKTPCQLDYEDLKLVNDMYMYESTRHIRMLAIGIALCIVSVCPVVILCYIDVNESHGVAVTFALIAAGVAMIVMSSLRKSAFTTLLGPNDRETVGGNQFTSQKNVNGYKDPAVDFFMSVYWPTVTCIYLSWSFLSFSWGLTWVIWPVAAAVRAALNAHLGGNRR